MTPTIAIDGISLRDWFAGLAMQALIDGAIQPDWGILISEEVKRQSQKGCLPEGTQGSPVEASTEYIINKSYEISDEMLAGRNSTQDNASKK